MRLCLPRLLILVVGLSGGTEVRAFEPPRAQEQSQKFQQFWEDSRVLPRELTIRVDLLERGTKTSEAEYFVREVEGSGGAVSWQVANPPASDPKELTHTTWQILMDPQLDESQYLTADGFDLVMCHELGHGLEQVEGLDQSAPEFRHELFADLYAVRRCLTEYWRKETPSTLERRSRIRAAINSAEAHLARVLFERLQGPFQKDNLCRRFQLSQLIQKRPGMLACTAEILGKKFAKRYKKELAKY